MIKEFQGEHRWLSNFAPCKIVLGGRTFPSVEAAYMSAKSEDTAWKDFCSDRNNTAGTIKKASRSITLRQDWESIKVKTMTECLVQKFSQEPFKSKLKATGNLHIQEGNMWNDKFWGVCLKTNKGQNILGKLIMHIRDVHEAS